MESIGKTILFVIRFELGSSAAKSDMSHRRSHPAPETEVERAVMNAMRGVDAAFASLPEGKQVVFIGEMIATLEQITVAVLWTSAPRGSNLLPAVAVGA